MEQVTRRTFLKFMGAAGVWTLSGCDYYPGPEPVRLVPEGWDRGEERWIASTCLQCPGGCGIRVRVYEGRAVKIEGNPEHPLNRGGLCPKGQAGLQVLYDPDRIPGPMRKVGARGSTEWESISWDEALDTVASRLRDLAARGKSQSVILWGGRFPGHMRELWERFGRAYGTPNLVDSDSLSNRAGRLANFLQQGVPDVPGFLLEDTRFLLVFGAGFLESWQPTVYTLRCYGAMRRGHAGKRARVVVVDPRCGIGASKADEWIAIRPGTDGALALGLAHVLIRDGSYNRAFVEERCFGFDDWTEGEVRHEGWKTLVLRDYAPDRVEELTGVPAEDIERLAHEFAESRPAVAAAGRGVGARPNGLFSHMAVHSLNALVGSLEVPGGVVAQAAPSFRAWPEIAPDEATRAALECETLGGRSPGLEGFPAYGTHGTLLDSLLSGSPYPAEAALVYYTNPLFSGPDSARYREALDRIPFVVSFSPFMDETTARADLVLPDATYLERLEDSYVLPSVGFPVLNLRQPVVRPRLDVRQTGDVVCDLARRVGGSLGDAFPWATYEEALRSAFSGLAAGPGSFKASKPEAFVAELKKRGFWSNGPYAFGEWSRVLATESGKFEFYSQSWKRHVEETASRKGVGPQEVLESLGIAARGDAAYMPHFESPPVPADRRGFPFDLVAYKTMMHAGGRGGNQPWLQESFGVLFTQRWEPWIEIHPEAAEKMGVHDAEMVWLESERGRVLVRARLHAGIRPDVIAMPYEYGHTEYGRWARGAGGNVNGIATDLVDRATGGHMVFATRVRVVRA